MAKINGTQIITNPVRLSYAHVFEPYGFNGGELKYSATLLIPKTDRDTLSCIEKAQKQAYENAKGDKLKGLKFEQVKTTSRDGNDYDLEESPEYKNMIAINVSCKTKPGIVDQYRKPIMNSSEVYSGCWCRADIQFFAYNTAGNRGISAGLNNIQKTKDDTPLGGRSRAEDVFDEWEDEDEDDVI